MIAGRLRIQNGEEMNTQQEQLMIDIAGEADRYRQALANVCEGWNISPVLRKYLESVLWSDEDVGGDVQEERIPIPTSANMAHGMLNLGLMYLKENAPDRLTITKNLQTLEDLYRFLARAHFERAEDEIKAALFAAKIKEMLGK